MANVRSEPELAPQALQRRLELANGDFNRLPAALTDEVMVVLVQRKMPRTGGSAAEMNVIYETELFQLVEGAVNCRQLKLVPCLFGTLEYRRGRQELRLVVGKNPGDHSAGHSDSHPVPAHLVNQLLLSSDIRHDVIILR